NYIRNIWIGVNDEGKERQGSQNQGRSDCSVFAPYSFGALDSFFKVNKGGFDFLRAKKPRK
ncbi:MAG: hypothetical protein KJO61_07845, partial [Deltaproteobacteria bacterium]|nr:hypothetical protein [Deltaproteobacteria bacterium]